MPEEVIIIEEVIIKTKDDLKRHGFDLAYSGEGFHEEFIQPCEVYKKNTNDELNYVIEFNNNYNLISTAFHKSLRDKFLLWDDGCRPDEATQEVFIVIIIIYAL